MVFSAVSEVTFQVVIPAQAGIQSSIIGWIPAFAGMTILREQPVQEKISF